MASKYSNKDFTGQDLSKHNDMDNQVIEYSCFANESPDTHVFPDAIKGTTVQFCNLDNVFIPAGLTVKSCSTRRFKVQNDGEDWIVDKNGAPVEPVDKDRFNSLKLSIDPKDIPVSKQVISVVDQKLADFEAAKLAASNDAIATVEATFFK